MSLEEDIQKLKDDFDEDFTVSGSYAPYIAAGLERDKIIIDRTNLPKVTERSTNYRVDEKNIQKTEVTRDEVKRGIRRLVALDQYLESREFEAATLARRRDELAQELFSGSCTKFKYIGDVSPMGRAIDRLVAAEAEVARLKGEGR